MADACCSNAVSPHGIEVDGKHQRQQSTATTQEHPTKWGYRDEADQLGPFEWGRSYAAANGQHQSPIDLREELVNPKGHIGPLLTKFADANDYTAHNNGHTVQFTPKTDFVSEVTGGSLTDIYRLAQFHFHWGLSDHQGSEHLVNGGAYAAEAHFVFVNTELYGPHDDPISKERGLTVLGVLMQVGQYGNPELQKLVNNFQYMRYPGQEIQLGEINISLLFPEQKDYYTYNGSLTTPPCYESVTWNVFRHPITISPQQLFEFRQLKNQHGNPIAPNFRPFQPMNGRLLFRSFKL